MTPRWYHTLLYPLGLVVVFLGTQLLLGGAGVRESQRAAIAAFPAVLALLLTLPMHIRRSWNEPEPWRALGIYGPDLGLSLSIGLLKAALLLTLVVGGLALLGKLQWQLRLSYGLLFNGLALGLGVGFAEELLFRGWLLGELTLLLGGQRALWLQASLFSLVHTRFNLPAPLLLGLLGGLLWLGLALGLMRRSNGGTIWGAIGLHGGLVGGWFVLEHGLVEIAPTAPGWLIGPANPIGGAAGWLGLTSLVIAQRRWWRRP